jgi:hypothetical protein
MLPSSSQILHRTPHPLDMGTEPGQLSRLLVKRPERRAPWAVERVAMRSSPECIITNEGSEQRCLL